MMKLDLKKNSQKQAYLSVFASDPRDARSLCTHLDTPVIKDRLENISELIFLIEELKV